MFNIEMHLVSVRVWQAQVKLLKQLHVPAKRQWSSSHDLTSISGVVANWLGRRLLKLAPLLYSSHSLPSEPIIISKNRVKTVNPVWENAGESTNWKKNYGLLHALSLWSQQTRNHTKYFTMAMAAGKPGKTKVSNALEYLTLYTSLPSNIRK